MCSILGASFAPGSTVNRHKLLSSLLAEGEVRGRDASGYAWTSDNNNGYYKKAVPGGQLHVGKLPADATAFIAHTRAATHGHQSNNDNNHPVLSPKGTIRLVHNGVLYNHEQIRTVLGEVGKALPEVDSSVLPAMIETFGLDSTENISGAAAAAWFEDETGATIHLAKFHSNPIHIAWLIDGSFVFASTAEILGRALAKAGLQWVGVWPGPFDYLTESDYIQILDGNIISETTVEWNTNYSYTGKDYSAQTSGGKSLSTYQGGAGGNQGTGSEDAPMALSAPNSVLVKNGSAVYSGSQGRTVIFGDPADWPDPDDLSDEDYDYWVQHGYLPGEGPKMDEDEEDIVDADVVDDGTAPDLMSMEFPYTFYVADHDEDETTFNTLHGMITNVGWTGGLNIEGVGLIDPEEPGRVRWVNSFSDLGHIDSDGEHHSWVRDKEAFEEFDLLSPSYIREGIDKLRLVMS